MAPKTILALAAACLLGMTPVAKAQAQYPVYSTYQAPPAPASWSYDPYTSGLTPCPQWRPGDLGRCHDRMPPTAGQPDYATH